MSPNENEIETKSQTQILFESVQNEVTDLQVVEGFFSAVERKFLQFSDLTFDVKKVKDTLATMSELLDESLKEEFFKADQVLTNFLLTWRKQLRERDKAIETQQIRLFCDEFKKPFGPKVFIALTRFYRNQPHSLDVQSKYDFAITRAFLKPTISGYREMRFERDEIVKQLNNLNTGWDIHITSATAITEEVIALIAKFDDFIYEAEFVTSFEELVNSQVFENLREFKRQIGELFYHPSVTASAIECNVFVGNIFAELLAQENEKLSRIVSNEFDFADVLHDTSSTAQKASNKILEQIRTDNLSQAINLDEDATQIWEWLKTVCAKEKKDNQSNEIPLGPEDDLESFLPAKQRVSHLFAIISKPNSDKTVLFEYLQKSPALRSLEMGVFLSPDNAESQKGMFLAILKAVVWAEELRTGELMKREDLSDETTVEISFILEELQTLSEQLKAKIDEMESEVTHNILYISNQLLETRLKLERALVRYSKQNLTGTLEHFVTAEEIIPPNPVQNNQNLLTGTFEVNRWLFVSTLLVVILSFGMSFFINNLTGDVKISKDIEAIETQQLPGQENWQSAQRVRDTLYVTAKDSWKELEDAKQEKILQGLLHQPTKTPLLSVIVTDINGDEVGLASAEQIETSKQISGTPIEN